MALDIAALWNYDQPAESEARFRAALAGATPDEALSLRTQIARTYSLTGRYADAHAELDAIAPALAAAGPEPRVRALLERGRTWRSSGDPAAAKPLFEQAFALADANGLEALAADALHMLPLVESRPEAQITAGHRLVAFARAASDPKARYWEAPGLNNLGVSLNDAGRHDEALAAFEAALVLRERLGAPGPVRIARWMVAHTLRLLGRTDDALAAQLALEQACDDASEPDRYVYEELALLYAARGDAEQAARYRERERRAIAAEGGS